MKSLNETSDALENEVESVNLKMEAFKSELELLKIKILERDIRRKKETSEMKAFSDSMQLKVVDLEKAFMKLFEENKSLKQENECLRRENESLEALLCKPVEK